MPKNPVLCIVGLGYVGLPLAAAFARKGFETIGYDINAHRINELKAGRDWTNELTEKQLKEAPIAFSADPAVISKADIVILAIPTPVDDANKPDLTLVESASQTVGEHLKKGMIVVYESTVYPGVTEDICGPILERGSGLTCGKDFTLGYSPERINPGDREHTVDKIMKIVAGQDEKTTDILCDVYGAIVTAGIHRAPSIKVAEMAKAIENAQRDINIAFINEVAMLSVKLGIRSKDVLQAAGTKWNFLRFQPGLVGGHCIGVDPYYLVEKAEQLGMKTHVIAAGRGINDAMGCFVAEQVTDALAKVKNPRVLVLGLTFKENIPDTRNSRVRDVIRHLEAKGCTVHACDPHVSDHDLHHLQVTLGSPDEGNYDAVLLLVPHKEFLNLGEDGIAKAVKAGGIVYDLKSLLNPAVIEGAGRRYVSL